MTLHRIPSFAATLVLAVAALAGGVFAGSASAQAAVTAGAPAANATGQLWQAAVTDPDGKAGSLAGFKGRPVVINFWASWCGPCVREMPELSALQREYQKKGIRFVGLGVDSAANVRTFLQKVPVAYPVYVVGYGGADLARAFGNAAGGLPFTVVIDANGSVRATKLGQIQPDELRHTLDAL